jgi:uncharacterized membrane protein
MQMAGEWRRPRATARILVQQVGALPPSCWLFFGLLAASIVGLVAAPWPLVEKFHAVVHGLCAQRPSHSFALGGTNLPFDARMTGIYGGTLTTILFLLARGRWRAMRLPSPGIIAVLALFVVAMGLDGVNSTLQDFQLPYAYEPNNYLRLGTGLLLGIGLGVMLSYLLNATLWAWGTPAQLVSGWGELAALLAVVGGVFLLVISGWGWLYLPLAAALVGGAVAVVLILALSFIVLMAGRENRAHRASDVAGFASAALLLGYAVMALIAVGRWYLETSLGIILPV